MAPSAAQTELTALLQALSSNNNSSITPNHIHLLEQSLLPTSPQCDRSLAYISLTKIVENASSVPSDRDEDLTKIFRPILQPFLQEDTGTSDLYLPPTTLLASLFPLAPAVCVSLLTTPLSTEEDSPDPLAVLLEMAELESPFQLAFGEMCVAASGTKVGREMIKARAMDWVRGGAEIRQNGRLSGVCCATLAKLGEGAEGGDLLETMLESLKTSSGSSSTILAIIEGLSIMSSKSTTKHYLSLHPTFLGDLLGLLPKPTKKGGSLPITPRSSIPEFDPLAYEPVDTSLCYGIVTILVSLSSSKPLLSAEDAQMAKLKAMAESGKKGGEVESDPLEEVPAVQVRVGRLYGAGVVSAMGGLARAESMLVRQMLGRLCLNLVEDKDRRMAFIREGGYKVLSEITRKLLGAYEGKTDNTTPVITPNSSSTDIDILPTLQANAKLIITTPPNLLFPPPHLTTSLNALIPLYTLLTHPTSSLLQTFEALMGLTNIASISPEIADRIVVATISPKQTEEMWRSSAPERIRVIGKIEELMMEDNDLVRRASTELICNLAGCEKGFEYLSGETEGLGKKNTRVKQRLGFLLVLMDIEDLGTRLAAGGALAVVTESSAACASILESPPASISSEGSAGRSTWKRLAVLLEPEEVEEEGEKIALISSSPPDEGMLLRVVCILFNLLSYTMDLKGGDKEEETKKAKEDGVEMALKGVLGMKVGEGVLRPAVECLKLMKGV